VSRTGRPDRAELLPRAALAAAVVALVALPLANAISRRYEREADWIALERTRDPDAAANLFRDLALSNALQPDPPRWAYVLFADHPSTKQRLELAQSFSAAAASLAMPPSGGPAQPGCRLKRPVETRIVSAAAGHQSRGGPGSP
jgi:predicted Zn-dependent protease